MSKVQAPTPRHKSRGARPDSAADRVRAHLDRQLDRMNVRGRVELLILRDLLALADRFATSVREDHDEACRCQFCRGLQAHERRSFYHVVEGAAVGLSDTLSEFDGAFGSDIPDPFREGTPNETLSRLRDLIDYADSLAESDPHDGPAVAAKPKRK